MGEAEWLLVDASDQVAAALAHLDTDVPHTVKSRWNRSPSGGNTVIWSEYSNVSTACPVVDEITYQVEIRACQRQERDTLARAVNTALLKLGLRRVYCSPDGYDESGAGYYSRIFRFGRRVDKRTMRLIDR